MQKITNTVPLNGRREIVLLPKPVHCKGHKIMQSHIQSCLFFSDISLLIIKTKHYAYRISFESP